MYAKSQWFRSTSDQGVFSIDLTRSEVRVQMYARLFEHLGLGDQLVLLPRVVVCYSAGLFYEVAMHYSAMINYSPG